jgi:hypothetical protein
MGEWVAYTSIDKFTCDVCDFKLEFDYEFDGPILQPDGWIAVTRTFDVGPDDEEIDASKQLINRLYCSDECHLDAIEMGQLDPPDE